MVKDKFLEQINAQLTDGEKVIEAENAQFKMSIKQHAGKDLAKSLAISALTAPFLGISVRSQTMPTRLFVAITNRNLKFFNFIDKGFTQDVGVLISSVPLEQITLQETNGTLKGLVVVDKETGQEVISLNFGVKSGKREALLAAYEQVTGNQRQTEKAMISEVEPVPVPAVEPEVEEEPIKDVVSEPVVTTKKRKSVIGLINVILGIIVAIFGLLAILGAQETSTTVIGAVLVVFGGMLFWRGRKRRKG